MQAACRSALPQVEPAPPPGCGYPDVRPSGEGGQARAEPGRALAARRGRARTGRPRADSPGAPRPSESLGRDVLGELLPAQRGRDGRAGLRPHRVDARDRLPPAVLALIEEDAAPLLLQPLASSPPGMAPLEQPRRRLGERAGVARSRPPRDRRRATWMPSAPLVFTYAGSPSSSSRPRTRCATRDGEGEAAVRRVEVEEDEVRPVGPVDARVPGVHVDAVHLHHPEQRLGALTSGKSTSRVSPSRGQVRNRRVGIQSGIPFGACFWKKLPPAIPRGSASS